MLLIIISKRNAIVLPVILIRPCIISGQRRLGFDLQHCPNLAYYLQNIKGWSWSPEMNLWHIPYYDNHLDYLQRRFGNYAIFTHHHTPSAVAMPEPDKTSAPYAAVIADFFQEMRLKRYSHNTQKTYASVLQRFFQYYPETDPKVISEAQIHEYLIYLVDKVECSAAYQRQVINAIKFLYQSVLKRRLNKMTITAPRQQKVDFPAFTRQFAVS